MAHCSKKGRCDSGTKKTLTDLSLDYLDLYLMHWPIAFRPGLEGLSQSDEDYLSLDEVPVIETWEAKLDVKNRV